MREHFITLIFVRYSLSLNWGLLLNDFWNPGAHRSASQRDRGRFLGGFLSLKQPHGIVQRTVLRVEAAPKRCTVRSDRLVCLKEVTEVFFFFQVESSEEKKKGENMQIKDSSTDECVRKKDPQFWIKLRGWQPQVIVDEEQNQSLHDRYSHSSVACCVSGEDLRDILLSTPLRAPKLNLHPFFKI